MLRCPYLEELLKERHGPLRVYRFGCHVDRRSKRRLALGDSPPICVRGYEECRLYREQKAREDRLINRYTD